MASVTVLQYDEHPLKAIGIPAGICTEKGKDPRKTALFCIESGHGRAEEFAHVTLQVTASAKMIRELYTHIVGTSRLQGSTRYIDFENFDYVLPESIEDNTNADWAYYVLMEQVKETYRVLKEEGIPNEDISYILPLAHMSKVVIKLNVRALEHMFELRTCNRAFHEFRDFMEALKEALRCLNEEWHELIELIGQTKCEKLGYCPELKGCGYFRPKAEVLAAAKAYFEMKDEAKSGNE